MWWTPLGERVLRGAGWELFRDGLSMVRDLVGEPKASGTATNEVDGRVPGDRDEDDGLWSPPEVSSEGIEEWEFLVGECLANRILWADGDHEGGPEFMDADPAMSRYCRNELG